MMAMITCNLFEKELSSIWKPTMVTNKHIVRNFSNILWELLKNFRQQIQKMVGLLGPGHYCGLHSGVVKTLLLRGNSFPLLLLGRALPQPSDSHKARGAAARQETAKDCQLGKRQHLEKIKKEHVKSTSIFQTTISHFLLTFPFLVTYLKSQRWSLHI